MSLARRLLLGLISALVLYNLGAWIWNSPGLVERRISSRIKLGMSASEVTQILGASKPFDMQPTGRYCGSNGPNVSRISLYTSGGLWLLLMTVPTETTFCFDSADRLVRFDTKRWVDGP
jgi:hypothetical protein